MTAMTQAQRLPLARHIASLRPDWDLAGIDSALLKLGLELNDPFEVSATAIAAARNPANRTPIVMTLPGPHRNRQPAALPTHGQPRQTSCTIHGNHIKRGDQWLCCWQEAQDAELAIALGAPDWRNGTPRTTDPTNRSQP